MGALLTAAALSSAATEVSFPSLDGTPVVALLYQPADAPKATVVALHGCGGLYAARGARAGQLSSRHQQMADLFVAEGYAVVFPDSLTPRGEREVCTQKIGGRRIDQRQRRADALATMNWVATQAWAKPDRIALIGWSHGGSGVLSAIDATRGGVTAQPARPAIAIAFYPGCSASLKANYRPDTRLVLMLGALDDWTPPGPCIELGQRAGAEVNVYPDSYHGFDAPGSRVVLRNDVPNGVNPGQGVHVGPNPAAREQALARVREQALARVRELLRETFP